MTREGAYRTCGNGMRTENHEIWTASRPLSTLPRLFPFERQVRQVCNHALGAARVSLPSLPDQDNSFAEIYVRKGLSPSQIDGKDDAKVTVTIGSQPQELTGQNYLYHFALLQVQFHATTAYDILRSVGVPIGKLGQTNETRIFVA